MAIVGNPASEQVISKPEYIESLRPELAKQVKRTNDLGIAACAFALSGQLATNPELTDTLYDAYLDRPQMNRQEAFNQAFRGFQSQALPIREELQYPRRFMPRDRKDRSISSLNRAADNWSEWIEHVSTDDVRKEQFHIDVVTRRNQATKEARGKAIKLVGIGLASRFGFEPSILDIGTSQQLIPKHLALERPFSRTYGVHGATSPNDRLQDVTDKDLTKQVRRMLNLRWRPTQIDTVDLFHPDDPLAKQWAEGCSFYPGELIDQEGKVSREVLRFQELINARPQSVRFAGADFSIPNPEPRVTTKDERGRNVYGERFEKHSHDIVTGLTMTYQLTPEGRETWFKNCLDYLKPGGVIVLSDFAIPDPDENGKILYLDDWAEPWSYRTFIYDSLSPDLGFQEIIRWYNGRCRSLQKGIGAAAIFGKDA